MFIDASIHGERNPEIERLAALKAIEFLSQVAAQRHKLLLPAMKIEQEPDSTVVREMWKACRMIMSTDLTPMAAVAGSISDAVADYLSSQGATRSIVNNGGDIALRTMEDAPVTVGIRSDISSHIVDYKLPVSGVRSGRRRMFQWSGRKKLYSRHSIRRSCFCFQMLGCRRCSH